MPSKFVEQLEALDTQISVLMESERLYGEEESYDSVNGDLVLFPFYEDEGKIEFAYSITMDAHLRTCVGETCWCKLRLLEEHGKNSVPILQSLPAAFELMLGVFEEVGENTERLARFFNKSNGTVLMDPFSGTNCCVDDALTMMECEAVGENWIGMMTERIAGSLANTYAFSHITDGPPHLRRFQSTLMITFNRVFSTVVSSWCLSKKASEQEAARMWLLPRNQAKHCSVQPLQIARGSQTVEAEERRMPMLCAVPSVIHQKLPYSQFAAATPPYSVARRQNNQIGAMLHTRQPMLLDFTSDFWNDFRDDARFATYNLESVSCVAFVSSDYSRLVAASKLGGGWDLDLRCFWQPLANSFMLQITIGVGPAIMELGETIENAFQKVSKSALRYCLQVGIPVPATADEVDWQPPETILQGEDELKRMFVHGATFFPAIGSNSGVDHPIAFVALPGDYSKYYLLPNCPKLQIGEHTIFGCVATSQLQITQDYTFLPVSLEGGVVKLLPWSSYVSGNSWELAIWIQEQQIGRVHPVLFSGQLVLGALVAGALELKAKLAQQSLWRVKDLLGRTVAPFVAPGSLSFNASSLAEVVVPLRQVTIDLKESGSVVQSMQRRTTVTLEPRRVRRARARANRLNTMSTIVVKDSSSAMKQAASVVLHDTKQRVTQPTQVVVKPAAVQWNKVTQAPSRPINVQLSDYVKAMVDPFSPGATGTKIPDTVIYPSTTYRLEMRLDITADNLGNMALGVIPWHRATLTTNNITNLNTVYDWKNAPKIDYLNRAAIDAQFSMARPVAGGVRVRYTGAALSAAGSITGALIDPAQTWPSSYSDVNNLPEFKEYSASAESAGVEVIWKPMTLHHQPYWETSNFIMAPGQATAFLPISTTANFANTSKSMWLSSDGGAATPYTVGHNDYPFIIVAGKGFPANAPFIIESVFHFEVVERMGTLQVGRNTTQISKSDFGALDQAANVLARMPAIREPGNNFLGKATKIVNGMSGLARSGFGLVSEVKRGLAGLL